MLTNVTPTTMNSIRYGTGIGGLKETLAKKATWDMNI